MPTAIFVAHLVFGSDRREDWFGWGVHPESEEIASSFACVALQNSFLYDSKTKSCVAHYWTGGLNEFTTERLVCKNGGWFAIAYGQKILRGNALEKLSIGVTCGNQSRQAAEDEAMKACISSSTRDGARMHQPCNLYYSALNNGTYAVSLRQEEIDPYASERAVTGAGYFTEKWSGFPISSYYFGIERKRYSR
jgi:hypothetical protein